MLGEVTDVQKPRRRLDEHSLEHLVSQFLKKDSVILEPHQKQPPKPKLKKKQGFEYKQLPSKPPSHPTKRNAQFIHQKRQVEQH